LVPYLTLIVAGLVGVVSLLLLGLFFLTGPFNLVDLTLGETTALVLDALLCLAFAVQHSVMVRRSFRDRITTLVPPHYHGLGYTIASGTVLLALVVFWQELPSTLVALDGVPRGLARVVQLLAMAGIVWGILSLGAFDIFGFAPILARVRGKQPSQGPIVARGPYRWVRHPLYFFILVMMWAYPDLTLDRLLLNTLWTVWIVAGTVFEERDLVADFGDEYRAYQRKVPMLIPWRLRGAREA
jgi:protein-S-isoprenylcysteine O-methyltransferase Ste14